MITVTMMMSCDYSPLLPSGHLTTMLRLLGPETRLIWTRNTAADPAITGLLLYRVAWGKEGRIQHKSGYLRTHIDDSRR